MNSTTVKIRCEPYDWLPSRCCLQLTCSLYLSNFIRKYFLTSCWCIIYFDILAVNMPSVRIFSTLWKKLFTSPPLSLGSHTIKRFRFLILFTSVFSVYTLSNGITYFTGHSFFFFLFFYEVPFSSFWSCRYYIQMFTHI